MDYGLYRKDSPLQAAGILNSPGICLTRFGGSDIFESLKRMG